MRVKMPSKQRSFMVAKHLNIPAFIDFNELLSQLSTSKRVKSGSAGKTNNIPNLNHDDVLRENSCIRVTTHAFNDIFEQVKLPTNIPNNDGFQNNFLYCNI
jgi:hypothetical protein